MICTVNKAGLHSDKGEACEDTLLKTSLDTCVNTGDVLTWNTATGDFIGELVQFTFSGV